MNVCFWVRIGSFTRSEALSRCRFIYPLASSKHCYSAKTGKRETDKVVYLLDVDGKHLGTKPLTDAENIAKKNKLLLVCTDVTTKYPTYKLESKSAQTMDMQREDSDGTNARHQDTKNKIQVIVKNLVITTKVSDHDLGVKLESAKKWLRRGDQVKVVITGDKNMFEKVFAKISAFLKDNASLKQKQSGNNLKFLCIPNESLCNPEHKNEPSTVNDSGDVEDANEIVNQELQQLLDSSKK